MTQCIVKLKNNKRLQKCYYIKLSLLPVSGAMVYHEYKFKNRLYVMFSKPRKFDTACVKCLTVHILVSIFYQWYKRPNTNHHEKRFNLSDTLVDMQIEIKEKITKKKKEKKKRNTFLKNETLCHKICFSFMGPRAMELCNLYTKSGTMKGAYAYTLYFYHFIRAY